MDFLSSDNAGNVANTEQLTATTRWCYNINVYSNLFANNYICQVQEQCNTKCCYSPLHIPTGITTAGIHFWAIRVLCANAFRCKRNTFIEITSDHHGDGLLCTMVHGHSVHRTFTHRTFTHRPVAHRTVAHRTYQSRRSALPFFHSHSDATGVFWPICRTGYFRFEAEIRNADASNNIDVRVW